MNCEGSIRYNNIPVTSLKQMGTPSYPFPQYQNIPMTSPQYHTAQVQQQPQAIPYQINAQIPQLAQTPMQNFESEIMVPPIMSTGYTQGYLSTQIGSKFKVEFLIGTNMLVDREGTLVEVGISYIVINETETDDLLLCDIYSIKFVKFYR